MPRINRNQFDTPRRSGQILLLFLVMMLLMLGLFALSINVGNMARERMEMQKAADSAAIGAARVQSLNLGFITLWNDRIIYQIGLLVDDIADVPLGWFKIPRQVENINRLKNQQDKALGYMKDEVEVTSLIMSRANGALLGLSTPSEDYQTHLELDLKRPWFTLDLIYERKSGHIPEKITVATMNNPFEKLFLGDLIFNGHHQNPVIAVGSAKPYYVFADPRTDDIGAWRWIATVLPGPWWQQRLVPTGEMPDKAYYMLHATEMLHTLLIDLSFRDFVREVEWYGIQKANEKAAGKIDEAAKKMHIKIDTGALDTDAEKRWAYWQLWLEDQSTASAAFGGMTQEIGTLENEIVSVFDDRNSIAAQLVQAVLDIAKSHYQKQKSKVDESGEIIADPGSAARKAEEKALKAAEKAVLNAVKKEAEKLAKKEAKNLTKQLAEMAAEEE